MLKTDRMEASSSLVMKAIIIGDDRGFADQASDTLQRIGGRADIKVDWAVRCWPASALTEKLFAEMALAEAVEAHLILLSPWLTHSLPLWLIGWLERWAELRRIRAAALATIENGNPPRMETPLHPVLSEFVRKHGLAFIGKNPLRADERTMLPVQFSYERPLALPVDRRGFSVRRECRAHRMFGINE